MHHRAGPGAGDAPHRLDLGHDQLAELVDAARLGAGDDVVRADHVVCGRDATDRGDLGGHRGRVADLGLDKDVGLDHLASPREVTAVAPDATASTEEPDISISDLGEFGLIARVVARLPQGVGTVLGPGDDAAVVRTPDGRVVASTDLLVEGRHFRRTWSSAYDIGRRAAAQNLADIAAMGAVPTALLVGLAVPADLPVDWVDGFTDGLAAECALVGAAVVGGDVVGSDVLTLGLTALGDLGGRAPVTRGGARVGDIVALAGRLGWSAAGLAVLQRGEPALVDRHAEVVAAFRRPTPPYAAGLLLADLGATAMIDVSDGLRADLGHVAEASGRRIELHTDWLPTEPALRAVGADLAVDPLTWVLTGGEDHALVATLPADAVLAPGMLRIGLVTDGSGVFVVGRQPAAGPGGFDHFAGSG